MMKNYVCAMLIGCMGLMWCCTNSKSLHPVSATLSLYETSDTTDIATYYLCMEIHNNTNRNLLITRVGDGALSVQINDLDVSSEYTKEAFYSGDLDCINEGRPNTPNLMYTHLNDDYYNYQTAAEQYENELFHCMNLAPAPAVGRVMEIMNLDISSDTMSFVQELKDLMFIKKYKSGLPIRGRQSIKVYTPIDMLYKRVKEHGGKCVIRFNRYGNEFDYPVDTIIAGGLQFSTRLPDTLAGFTTYRGGIECNDVIIID